MAQALRRTGINPTAYLGVEAITPPNLTIDNRNPTSSDYIEFNLGDMWLNENNQDVFMLVSKANNSAVWTQFGAGGVGVLTLTGDSGGAVGADMANNINLLGTVGQITVAGNPGSNTLTWSLNASIATQYDTDAGTATPAAGILEVIGGVGVSTSGAGNTITIAATPDVPTQFNADTSFAVPVANVLNIVGANGIVTTGNTSNTLTISTDGSITNRYDADTSFAVPVAGVVDILGGFLIETVGDSMQTLLIEADNRLVTDFVTDTGTANGSVGILNIVGGTGIATSAAGNTVTIDLTAPSGVLEVGVQFNTSPGTDPVVPDIAGEITINGSTVANATNLNAPVATHSRAVNALNVEVQVATSLAAAPPDMFDAGLASFDEDFASVNSNGFVSFSPTVPGFYAYVGTTLTNVTGDGTVYTIPFNTTLYNVDSVYNSGTGVFTANKTGIWLVSYQVTVGNLSASHTEGGTMVVNPFSNVLAFWGPYQTRNVGSASSTISGASFIFLNSGQTASVTVFVLSGTKTVSVTNGSSFFMARYMGAS